MPIRSRAQWRMMAARAATDAVWKKRFKEYEGATAGGYKSLPERVGTSDSSRRRSTRKRRRRR